MQNYKGSYDSIWSAREGEVKTMLTRKGRGVI